MVLHIEKSIWIIILYQLIVVYRFFRRVFYLIDIKLRIDIFIDTRLRIEFFIDTKLRIDIQNIELRYRYHHIDSDH